MAVFEFDPSISSAVRAGEAPPRPADPLDGPLGAAELSAMQRYWQAANYLTIGQIYLQDNPLLRSPLRAEDIKPRLLGHWGTSPGLSIIYVHLNRLIRARDLDVLFIAGPGHGGPAVVANVYLEGTYSEIYPAISRDEAGLRALCRQFSTPGGIPSHVSAPTPGSIHEGGELGYALAHACGAAFDNPNLVVVAVIGDGEAETGPAAASWKGLAFLNPARDGAVLPILHLNGYKISGPTVLGRTPDRQLRQLFEGHGYEVTFVEGDDPAEVHQALASALDRAHDRILELQHRARRGATADGLWPVIVLRTPKGWTGPVELDGLPVAGTFRAHQVPLSDVKTRPDRLALLETWMRSYQPETLFDASGRLHADLAALAPAGDRRMGANRHANGGQLLVDLVLPDLAPYAIPVPAPATVRDESTRALGRLLADVFTANAASQNFRVVCPDETTSNRLGDMFRVENRCFVGRTIDLDDRVSPTGRVMEVLSEHLCEGWLEGYLMTGRHGLYVTYEAFAMISASMTVQHTKWLQEAARLTWRAPLASLNILLTSTCWRNDHNGFSHQGPGLIDVMLSKNGPISRIYLPPDGNSLLWTAQHCFESRGRVNLIVIDKQPQLQWMTFDEARLHCERGASTWSWAGHDEAHPDVILASAGDVPTLEIVAAAAWLRTNVPELRFRVVNVVDLMALFPPYVHPHGMGEATFAELFTRDKPVIFAFHGYQRALHELLHGRPDPARFHVRGFNEQGTTTTPFSMVAMNYMSRYHLVIEALRYAPLDPARIEALTRRCQLALDDAKAYIFAHFEDPPEIQTWTWPGPA